MKRKPHDWILDIGPVYRCSVCRLVLTQENEKSHCVGMKSRDLHEHAVSTEPLMNRFPYNINE